LLLSQQLHLSVKETLKMKIVLCSLQFQGDLPLWRQIDSTAGQMQAFTINLDHQLC
jgi:hypothetical protein